MACATIAGVETARQHETLRALASLSEAPVEGHAVAAGQRIGERFRRLGVEEDHLGRFPQIAAASDSPDCSLTLIALITGMPVCGLMA